MRAPKDSCCDEEDTKKDSVVKPDVKEIDSVKTAMIISEKEMDHRNS